MANKDTGWRPKGAMDAFGGYEIWEYERGPHQINDGTVDGEIDFEKYAPEDGEEDAFATSVDDIDDEDDE